MSGSENWELARRSLARSIQIIDRITEENKLTAPGCDLRYPENSAICRRTKAYAQSLLGGSLDTDSLILGSREFETYFNNHDYPRERNDQTCYRLINSIHLALIGNDLERATDLLGSPPAKSRYNKPHFDALKGLVKVASGSLTEQKRREAVERFESFFNRARDPRQKFRGNEHLPVTLGPLELAIIRDRYIYHGGDQFDWKRIIAAYSE